MKLNKKKIIQYLPVAFMGACTLAMMIFLIVNKGFSIEEFLSFTKANPIYCAIAVLICFVAKGFVAVVPYSVIVISAMILMNFRDALIVVIIGSLLCISVPYWVGRVTKDDWIKKILEKHPKIRSYYEESDNLFVLSFTLRALNLSNEGLGLLFGSAGLSYFPYLISSVIAILPSATCYVVLGDKLDGLRGLTEPLFWIAVAVDLLMITGTFLYHKKKREKKRALEKKESEGESENENE